MQQDFEALNLQSFGFHRCYFYELHCQHCNARVRIALENESVTEHPCPVCSELQAVEFLARGFSKQALPFYEGIPRDVDDPIAWKIARMKFRASLPAEQRVFCGTH